MDKKITWLIRLIILFVLGGIHLSSLNLQKNTSSLVSNSSIEDVRYKELENKRYNAEFVAKRDSLDYEKF